MPRHCRRRGHFGADKMRAAVLALSCAVALAACKGGGNGEAQAKPNAEKSPEAVPVEVASTARRAIAASYTGTAPLEALADSQVVAKTSGVALSVLVEEGQQVRAGQVLVRLDSARAALEAARTAATMRKLENNYRRAQQLVEQQMLALQNVVQSSARELNGVIRLTCPEPLVARITQSPEGRQRMFSA